MAADVLLVDDGERDLYAALTAHLNARQVQKVALDAGDLFWYTRDETVLAERKRADDLVQSILDDRLLDECQRMKDADHRWLFVEGALLEHSSNVVAAWGPGLSTRYAVATVTYSHMRETIMPYRRVEAELLKLEQWAGIRVWGTRDTEHTAAVVAHLWRSRDTPPVLHLWRPGVELMKRNPVAAAYLTVEHIGEKTALALAAAFPCEYDLMSATDEQLRGVEGIGDKRLVALRRRYGRGPNVPTVRRVRSPHRQGQR